MQSDIRHILWENFHLHEQQRQDKFRYARKELFLAKLRKEKVHPGFNITTKSALSFRQEQLDLFCSCSLPTFPPNGRLPLTEIYLTT